MSINFFDKNCQEPIRTDRLFGLCDTIENELAFTNVDDNDIWIAIVKNDNECEITFTAIDSCVINSDNITSKGQGRCDAMLTATNQLFLVELKDRKKSQDWRQSGRKQLEDTIRLLLEKHELNAYKKRKAFICNKRMPLFETIENSVKRSFMEANPGFRLHIGNEIVVK